MLGGTSLPLVLLVLISNVVGYNKNINRNNGANNNSPLISTPTGPILGSTMTTRLGKTIYAFRGIRYGKAPVGELRFQPPQPAEQWSGTYNATVDAPLCPQPANDPISEDCLFLNVYSTKLPVGGNNPKRPVIMHLHAGGFYGVTGRSNWAGPQYFMDQDIVLVTLNYRLGSLGWLSIGKECPGNLGLKDQVLAMKWIKKNIAAFGGDPDSVTLFGYSAGSFSINLHMVSPMSRGLFHKAICSSGSSLGIWPLPHRQLDLAKKQARLVGCPDTTPAEIYKCLKTKPAEELGNSLLQFFEFGNNPILLWSPVIEEDYGQERFLPDDPIKLIQNGNFAQVPFLTGVTKDEFAYVAIPIVRNSTMLTQLSDNFEKLAPICFIYESDTAKSIQVSKAARKFYLGDAPLSQASLSGLEKLFYDSIEGFPVTRAANLIAEKSCQPAYFYHFTYQGRYSHYYLPDSNGTVPYGVVHHDDLIYLFYISILFPFFNDTYPEAMMVDKLGTLWANFAKTGKPIPQATRQLDNVIWEPYNKNTQNYMDIGAKLVPKERLHEDRNAFWERFYPISDTKHFTKGG